MATLYWTMGSLLPLPFYLCSTWHLMEDSASAKSEVIEYDQHGWVEVEAYGKANHCDLHLLETHWV